MQQEKMVYGVKIPHITMFPLCLGYIFGKQHQESFLVVGAFQTSELFKLVYSDICGLMDT